MPHSSDAYVITSDSVCRIKNCALSSGSSIYPKKLPVSEDVNIDSVAEDFDGISGSDIANAVFSAAVSAAYDESESVSDALFRKAVQSCINVKHANQNSVTRTRVVSAEQAKAELGIRDAEESYSSVKNDSLNQIKI